MGLNDDRFARTVGCGVVLWVIVALVVWGAIIFVASHFIAKWW